MKIENINPQEVKLASISQIFFVGSTLFAIVIGFFLIIWAFSRSIFVGIKSSEDILWRILIFLIVFSFITLCFYLSRFKSLLFGNDNIALLRRYGNEIKIHNDELSQMKIYWLSLAGPHNDMFWFLDIESYTKYKKIFLLKIKTSTRTFFCLIEQDMAEQLESRVEKSKLNIPNFSSVGKKFNQNWYWLILFLAIIFIFGLSLLILTSGNR